MGNYLVLRHLYLQTKALRGAAHLKTKKIDNYTNYSNNNSSNYRDRKNLIGGLSEDILIMITTTLTSITTATTIIAAARS